MGKPKAPNPPDYAAAAKEQGQQNTYAALASNYLNQANQVGPNGSLTYNYSTPGSGQGYTTPDGIYIPQATATTTLSPDQQKLYDQNMTMSQSLNDIGIGGLNSIGRTMGSPLTGDQFQSLKTGLAAPQLQGQLDTSGVTNLPTLDEFKGQRDQITQAYMDRLAPYMKQQQDQMVARLATQGITNGSEAWNYDQNALNRGQNDQRIAALLAGDQAQQNLFNNALATHQSGMSDALSRGNFANNTASTGFQQGLASDQFANQAQQQAIQEADYFKNQPLNMLNALRSGNQVTMPQFGNVMQGSNIAAAPTYQATADSYNAALQKYQADLQSSGGLLGGLANLGGAVISKWSDRRLKKNIRLLGIRPDGLGVYSYDYIWGGSDIGVMADEVAILRPDALGPTLAGYATVNYGAL